MKRYVAKRLIQFIPVILGISFITFYLMHLSPSDPASIRLSAGGITPTRELIEKMREEMGLNEPIIYQYVNWLFGILKGDFGNSYITSTPISQILMRGLPTTVILASVSMILTLVISIPLGIISAAKKDGLFDRILGIITFIGNSTPNFIIGMILLYIFTYKLGVFSILDNRGIAGFVMPSLTLAIVMSSRYIRQIRAATIDELSRGYAVALRAKGVSENVILFKNVMKNIMIMVITLTGVSFGSLLGGTVAIELIFNLQGLGSIVINSIGQRDYPVVQGFVVWMAAAYLIVNLLTDISYKYFDARVEY